MKATLRIQNFRILEDVTINLKPTTLLLGPNGSGKSTFIKALVFLSQNLRSGKLDNILFDFPKQKINLRTYDKIVTN